MGFDFVFITDHDQWNDHSDLSDAGLKVFSALERSCRGGREHVVALGVHEWAGPKDTQEAIDWVNDIRGVALMGDSGFFNHKEIKPEKNGSGVEYEQPIPPQIRTYARVEMEVRFHQRAWLQPVWPSRDKRVNGTF